MRSGIGIASGQIVSCSGATTGHAIHGKIGLIGISLLRSPGKPAWQEVGHAGETLLIPASREQENSAALKGAPNEKDRTPSRKKSEGASEIVTHGKTAAARRMLPMTPRVRAILEMHWERAGKPLEGWIWASPTASGHVEPSTLKKQHPRIFQGSGGTGRGEQRKARSSFRAVLAAS